jgi:hypothetical protein
MEARVATVSERPMPPARTVDASADGVLLAFAEPVGLRPDMRVCITMRLPDGRVHLTARVARATRGDDFRTYVAVSLRDQADQPALDRWRDWLTTDSPTTGELVMPPPAPAR